MVLLDSYERMGRRVIRSNYHPGAARHPPLLFQEGSLELLLLFEFIHASQTARTAAY